MPETLDGRPMTIPAPPTPMPRFTPNPFDHLPTAIEAAEALTLTFTLDATRFRDALAQAADAASRAHNSARRADAEYGQRVIDALTAEAHAPHFTIRHRCFDAAVSRTVRDLGFTVDDLDVLRNAMANPGGHL